VVILRELLIVFHGNELSIGIILAAWLLWTGIGSYVGIVLATRALDMAHTLLMMAMALFFVLPLTLAFSRLLRGFFGILPGVYLSFLDIACSCFLLLAPCGLLIGAMFTLIVRGWRESTGKAISSAAGTYMSEALGNILGGMLFTLLLVHYLNAFLMILLAGGLLSAVLATHVLYTNTPAFRLPKGRLLLVLTILVALLSLWPLSHWIDTTTWRLQWHSMAPEHSLVETVASKYGPIAVLCREDQYSFYQSGNLLFSAAGKESELFLAEDLESAVFAHFAMCHHENPRDILLIGGGIRGTLREILRHPVERLDYIELDRKLVDVAQSYVAEATVASLDDPRVRVILTDGRLFVRRSRKTYDMIIVDMPDPATASMNRYYTKEFFQEVSRSLNPGGMFMMGAESTVNLRGSAIANRNATLFHTLDSIFEYVLPAGQRLLLFIAGQKSEIVSCDSRLLQDRLLERGIDRTVFSPRHFDLLLEEGQLRRINWILRHHGRGPRTHLSPPQSPPFSLPGIEEQIAQSSHGPAVDARSFINSDFKPIAYYYTLVYWGGLTRSDHAALFRELSHVNPLWVLFPFAMALFFAVILRALVVFSSRTWGAVSTRYALSFAVFTTGFSTMTLQVALLFVFQNVYGFVYEMVGLIVALFMTGLVTGTATAQRWIRDKANPIVLAKVQAILAIYCAILAVFLPRTAYISSPTSVFLLFSGITWLSGFLNGIDFPLATSCCHKTGLGTELSTGMVYGTELFGASLGAVLAGVALVPILGVAACSMTAAFANAAAFVIIIFLARE